MAALTTPLDNGCPCDGGAGGSPLPQEVPLRHSSAAHAAVMPVPSPPAHLGWRNTVVLPTQQQRISHPCHVLVMGICSAAETEEVKNADAE